MRPRPLIAAMPWLLASLLISGCALTPQVEPEPVLSPDAFDARIDRLEQTMALRCDQTEDRLSRHDLRQIEMMADVRDASALLQQLRGSIQRLEQRGEEPVIVMAECNEEANASLGDKALVGRAEWIGLPDIGTYLRARIDSGANTSSLSAKDITRFERDGEDWVRFRLGITDDDIVVDKVRNEWIEAPVERRVRIVQAAGSESRPVVSLLMTLGSIREPVEFTLNDRTHLNFPVLLGRRFLMDIALIDVAETYLHPRPEFPGGRPAAEAEQDELNDQEEEDR
ncbi:ATP-dependent zinc protease [Halomonas sp. ANAO-440]|uniref:ATP-dependent zinc protease family protein n=1 Tax=Halomonas sp. ANAO-440 TaxID=2861360 RepID=UPI001CAA73D6|nr:ATP-dependent zinc protease [Halomonas sp. ANAO-440]MBZ0330386.1 ATP-dependent zinc protease [Halomonas sp. ANAO-440]